MPSLGQRLGRDAARHRAGHAGLHEPRAGRAATSTGSARGRDVYSLGATLYCLLTGKPPFEGDDVGAVLRTVQRGDFPPPRQLDPSIDPALEAVCLKAMAPQPEDRYATRRALADDVERWMADEPVSAWREPLVAAGAAVGAAEPDGGHRAGGRGAGRRWSAPAPCSPCRPGPTAGSSRPTQREPGALANGRARSSGSTWRWRRSSCSTARSATTCCSRTSSSSRCATSCSAARPTSTASSKGCSKDQPDRASRAALGKAYSELGELTAKIGDKPAALAAHRKALAVRRELASEPAADAEARGDVARSLLAVGRPARRDGQLGRGPRPLRGGA